VRLSPEDENSIRFDRLGFCGAISASFNLQLLFAIRMAEPAFGEVRDEQSLVVHHEPETDFAADLAEDVLTTGLSRNWPSLF